MLLSVQNQKMRRIQFKRKYVIIIFDLVLVSLFNGKSTFFRLFNGKTILLEEE